MLRIFGGLTVVSLAAIFWALFGPYAAAEPTPVDMLNLTWAGLSAFMTSLACLVCFERPRLHREELFETDQAGRLIVEGQDVSCRVHRLSTVDASVSVARLQQPLDVGAAVDLAVEGLQPVRGHIAHHRGHDVLVSLALPEVQRRALLVALYGRPNNNVPLKADLAGALRGVLRRSVGCD